MWERAGPRWGGGAAGRVARGPARSPTGERARRGAQRPHSQAGGSGERVDIAAIPDDMSKPYVLAGGLTPDNVYAALRAASPWGVDVASGIEREPGIKDGALMRRFVEEVRRADCIELGDNGDIGECNACGR